MSNPVNPDKELLDSLKERAKELNCLYQVEEALHHPDAGLGDIFQRIVDLLPKGLRFPEVAQASISYKDDVFTTDGFVPSAIEQAADIVVQDIATGSICWSYTTEVPVQDGAYFLPEEARLLSTLADRISQSILHRQLEPVFQELHAQRSSGDRGKNDWRIVMDMLRVTDQDLFLRISRRMLNYLCYIGIPDAREVLQSMVGLGSPALPRDEHDGINRPLKKHAMLMTMQWCDKIFSIASRELTDEVIYSYVRKWIRENKVNYLIDVLESHSSTLSQISAGIRRYRESGTGESDLSPSTVNAVRVSLIRRFFSRRLEFIDFARKYISIDDFADLTDHFIAPANSSGKMGGKSTGLFIAMQIIKRVSRQFENLKDIRVPKTWYIASDGVLDFIHYNHLEELMDHKYRDLDQIRMEYPNIVQLFKNSSFSPEMIKGLSMALDDFGDRPLIVRSSSLLEDSVGAAFSGKYKSLFIANQGTKQERLEALMDAIAEVYASMFGADPIEYRAERGLLDYQEEMAIMLQEVVGDVVGDHLFPAYAGVGFSNNEFRWSPRIKRENGLLRLVPGLGTRAVDRLGDDYPVLIAPGQPGLRVNATIDETVQYAPHFMDAINLKTNAIETIKVEDILRSCGDAYPRFRQVFSQVRENMLMIPGGLHDFDKDYFVATFDGLVKNTPFIRQMRELLSVLKQHFQLPMDIEFAADGNDFYLLQCRPQSSLDDVSSVPIPADIPDEDIIFTANKYVSEGQVPDISHIVYVDPAAYDALETLEDLKAVGTAVARLNSILPKRHFILMGPGRWGSRGDIKLGVEVTYSGINNTAALIEVAFRKGNYVPDLSFGTHFFQDLVEASIRYLPLYPDDGATVFNRSFLRNNGNILERILPEAAHLAGVIRVIDVPAVTGGKMARLLMNADEGKALCYLGAPLATGQAAPETVVESREPRVREDYWRWRMRMAEKIAAGLDAAYFGVKGIYIFGSTKNAHAGPCSDIDLLVHVGGTAARQRELSQWLDGWSLALGEINYLRTGCKTERLLDVHFVTDEDIANRTSYAVKIGAISDAARPLKMGKMPDA